VAGGMPTAIHLKGPKAVRNQTNLHITGRRRLPDQSIRKNIAHQILAHTKCHAPNTGLKQIPMIISAVFQGLMFTLLFSAFGVASK
jgi:hypothetical protein